jgi:hypothetical protein
MSGFDEELKEPEAAPEPVEAKEAVAAEDVAHEGIAVEAAPQAPDFGWTAPPPPPAFDIPDPPPYPDPPPGFDQADPPPGFYQTPPGYQPPPGYQQQPPPPEYAYQQTPPPGYQQTPPGYQPPPGYQQTPPGYQPPPGYYQAPQPGYGYQQGPPYPRYENQGLFTAAFVFIIIGAVIMSISTYGIGLAWCIPMTIHASRIWKGNKPNTIAFGVCSLLFVGLIGGILLLVAPKDQ